MHQTLGFIKDLKNEKSKKIHSSSEKKTQKSEEIGKPSEKSSKIGIFSVKSEDLATLLITSTMFILLYPTVSLNIDYISYNIL